MILLHRSLAALLAASLLLIGTGCATRAATSSTAPRPKEVLSIPADLVDSVERARLLGLALYTQDAASAIATDVLIQNIGSLEGKGLGGWITVRDADVGGRQTGWWLVKFFSDEPQPAILYEVRVPTRPELNAIFTRLDPPLVAKGSSRVLIAARAAAIAAAPEPTRAMNTVLLPGEPFGYDGTLVYLLAATTDPEVMVLGKHYRILVSGTQPNAQVSELSRSQLEVPLRRGGAGSARIVAPWVKHTVSEAPLESYVFASLFHRIPIFVETSRGVWWVDGSDISLIADRAPARASDLLE
ncbi:MAG TPA: hypothetical protein VEB21_11875 [Terriglobales bacterium]|nr:hypothetical protein [Terriglobales bacterium]